MAFLLLDLHLDSFFFVFKSEISAVRNAIVSNMVLNYFQILLVTNKCGILGVV